MDDFGDTAGTSAHQRHATGCGLQQRYAQAFEVSRVGQRIKAGQDAIKIVAKALLEKLSSGKLQIDHWREKATAQAQVKAEIIKHLFSSLPAGAYAASEINLKASAVFTHIYTIPGFSGGNSIH